MANAGARIEVPAPRERLVVRMPDGAETVVRRHGDPGGRRVLLSHGNGYAIDAYYPFWGRLLDRFDVLVYDQRNHGQNAYAGSHGHHLDGFAADLQRVIDAVRDGFGDKPLCGAFHSVSAITALVHATSGRDWPWRRLVLFDPPLVPPPGEALHARARGSELFMANWAMQRPDRFARVEEMVAVLRETRALSGWTDGAHDLVARSLLRESDAGWSLRCPRELEALIYVANGYSTLWSRLGSISEHRQEILLLSADPERESAKYPALVALRVGEVFGYGVRPVSGTTHMLQIERPEVCAAGVREFLSG